MNRITLKSHKRARRKRGLRKRIFGVPNRPRLTVFRSAKHIYAQIIDDLAGKTLVAASTNEKTDKVAKRAVSAGVTQVVFDRSGFRYHGRIKALADAAREGGLKF